MGGQINISISASTFQNLPKDNTRGDWGENFSTVGTNINYNKIPHWTVYTGLGVTAPDKTDPENVDKKTSCSFIGDIKSSHKYYDGENLSLSFDSRSRFNVNESSQTLAVRVAPASVNVPIGDNVSLYAVPYVLEKVDFQKGVSLQSLKDNLRLGLFGGIKGTVKIGDLLVNWFIEGQGYNLMQNIKAIKGDEPMDWGTIGFNGGVSFSPFSIKW
ncbi:hypothetical protein J6S88_00285 [bacterium]|nr:hypothetical protein [bacterium]